jgi:TetR/AcrR family transcriptional regulator, regulator of cefoperazone and chloramphenicol sensitivity
MQKKKTLSPDTRSRLLQAAGEIFARHGFRRATVRMISGRAHANIAAVRYYFGGKEGLYAAVLQHTFITANQKYPPTRNLPENAPPLLQLRTFIHTFLLRILDDGRPAWHGKLMIREIADPTPVLDQVIDEMFKPLYSRLIIIIGDFFEEGTDEEVIRLCAMSIMGQCLFYRHSRPVVARLFKKEYSPADIEMFADHITTFSLQALRGIPTFKGPDHDTP